MGRTHGKPRYLHVTGLADLACSSVLLIMLTSNAALGQWGSISIANDAAGHKEVTIENSTLRAKFYKDPRKWGGWIGFQPYCIKEFLLKSIGQDLEYGTRARFDDDMAKDYIRNATVTNDGADRKTVRLEYWYDQCAVGTGAAEGHTWCGQNIEIVTIYQGVPVIKTVYDKWALFLVDYNEWPVGEKKKVFYGEDDWPRTHDRDDPLGRHVALGEDRPYYYIGGENPGSLSYKGYLIFGEFMPDGRGYGRVAKPEFISGTGLKLWDNGWEVFHKGGTKPVYYLFGVDGGKEEILSLGKAIVDFAVAGELGTIGGAVAAFAPTGTAAREGRAAVTRTSQGYLVSLGSAGVRDVSVVRADGKVVYESRCAGSRTEVHIDRGALSPGTYVVHARDTEDNVHTGRFAVSR